MSDLKTKLQSEIEECSWELLDRHLERGAVFLIDTEIELVDVGVALAEDQSQTVANWLTNKQIIKLELSDADKYSKNEFKFLIVQPYVLVKIKN